MILFYQEEDGGFLAIDTDTRSYYLATSGRDECEGRAAALSGLAGSVCTTGISKQYLREKCKRVAKAKVPVKWLKAIGY